MTSQARRGPIGITGSGNIGQAFARTAVPAGRQVVIAVPWASIPAAGAGLTWLGQIVIDATNPFVFPEFRPADLDGRTSSEIVAELVQGAWVVKAANTIAAGLLGGDPRQAVGSRGLFLSGNDASASAEVDVAS